MGADLNYGFSRLTTERPKQRTTPKLGGFDAKGYSHFPMLRNLLGCMTALLRCPKVVVGLERLQLSTAALPYAR